MMMITDGMFATLGNVTLPTANLSSLSVKTCIYKLPQTDDTHIFWTNNSALTSQLCEVGGHFEPILKNLENPLFARRNFFSYLANLKRALTNDGPQYSYVYEDFDKIGGNITTVTKTGITYIFQCMIFLSKLAMFLIMWKFSMKARKMIIVVLMYSFWTLRRTYWSGWYQIVLGFTGQYNRPGAPVVRE